LSKVGLSLEQTAFVGDDLLDVPVMKRVGLAVAVADAHACAKDVAHWITTSLGGNGAVREVADALFESQGGMQAVYDGFLRSELGDESMRRA
jgi:3-deoxy-D-manno-octulosonate 8-phosphate phosphatase (KDO 8-P phosphatase)